MRIAVIGAGPAGLTCAKQALERGMRATVYEQGHDLGGIWDPGSGGAYEGVRMQSSRMSFPFSDHAPAFAADFPRRAEVHGYLDAYARRFAVTPVIRFDSRVTSVVRRPDGWRVTARCPDGDRGETYDAVMIASGELWEPRVPALLPEPASGVRVVTAKQYRSPAGFEGERVLVVGGGVSGADIAAEVTATAASVEWSVRRRQLFLPRTLGGIYNDALFSYAGRVAVEDLPYEAYLKRLAELDPEYFAAYRRTGLLPADGFHGAVHVNDRIVPAVDGGRVAPRAAFERFERDGLVRFADGTADRYDTVILCMGYEAPDYGFVPGLRQEDLYEHFFHRADPTLAVVNTPVATEAFGTACPYFEAIGGWVLRVLAGEARLPDRAERDAWCARHAPGVAGRYYDCWLETIRIGLRSGAVPAADRRFREYWRIVSGQPAPESLLPDGPAAPPGVCDDWFDLEAVRLRILAGLGGPALDRLVAAGEIGREDARAARAVPAGQVLPAWLPYRGHPVGATPGPAPR